MVRPTVSEEDFYRFGHSVIKDAAYRSLLKRDRAELHERFVGWAEPINRERGRELEFEEILGYHLEQAYRYRTELGPLDDAGREVGGRAAAKLASAGKRALGRGDAPAAANLLRRAADLLESADPRRIELLTDQVYALLELGEFDVAKSVLDEAGELATSIEDGRLGARTRVAALHVDLYGSGLANGTDHAVREVMDSLDALDRAGDIGGTVVAWRLLMLLHGTDGQFERCADAARRVVDLGRQIGDTRLAASGAVGYATSVLLGPTSVSEAIPRCEQLAIDVSGDRKAEAVILRTLAQLVAMQGRFDTARELYTQSDELIADLGPSITGSASALESSRVEVLAGEYAAAEALLRRDYLRLGSRRRAVLPIEHRGIPGTGALGAGEVRGRSDLHRHRRGADRRR